MPNIFQKLREELLIKEIFISVSKGEYEFSQEKEGKWKKGNCRRSG